MLGARMIGVFDSGYGGLSVLKTLTESFPDRDFIYLGDNARAPYGNRSADIITRYTAEALEWLFYKGAAMTVLACNTASAEALPRLSAHFLPHSYPSKKVVGVIEPVAHFVAAHTAGDIGVIATKSTIRSGVYGRALAKTGRKVHEIATPLLVPLVEDGRVEGTLVRAVLNEYLDPLVRAGIQTLILGCTHYRFLEPEIRALYPALALVDAAAVMPRELAGMFSGEKKSRPGKVSFYTTDEEDGFAHFVERHLDLSIRPERIQL